MTFISTQTSKCITILILWFVHTLTYAQTIRKYEDLKDLYALPLYTSLSKALKTPDKVYRLALFGKNYKNFPVEVFRFKNLRWLDLGWDDKNKNIRRDHGESKNYIRELPSAIGQLKQLEFLSLRSNLLNEIPAEIGQLRKLKYLSFSWNNILSIPKEIGKLHDLRILHLIGNRLSSLPPELTNLKRLWNLWLSNNLFEDIPVALLGLKQLKKLSLNDNPLTKIPTEITCLEKLIQLHASNCKLTELPENIGQLKRLKVLSVYNNQLEVLPESVGQLKQLEELHIYKNRLIRFPDKLGQLAHLIRLDASKNQITHLPISIGQLTKIRQLVFSHNRLKTLPKTIVNLCKIKRFDVSYNDSLKITSFFFDWLARNNQGLSPRIAQQISKAKLEVLRQQATTDKRWQLLQHKKSHEQRSILFVGTMVFVTLGVGILVSISAQKQRRDRQKINEQAEELIRRNQKIRGYTTELHNSVAQLEELQRFRQQTEAMLTQDLEQPLHIIQQVSTKPLTTTTTQIIHKAGLQMNHLVTNMLNMQKFKAVGIKTHPRLCLLANILDTSLAQLAYIAPKQHQIIQELNNTSQLIIEADEVLITQMFINLLLTCIHNTSPEQTIIVDAKKISDEWVEIVIARRCRQRKTLDDDMLYNQPSMSTKIQFTLSEMIVKAHGGNIQLMKGSNNIYSRCSLPITIAELNNLQNQPFVYPSCFIFNDQEKQQLSHILPILRQQMVYQVTKIEHLLESFIVEGETTLALWKKAVLEAVKNCDDQRYKALLYYID